jgi:hypothetical protein
MISNEQHVRPHLTDVIVWPDCFTRLVYTSLVLAGDMLTNECNNIGRPLGNDMMSHGSSILCIYSIVLAANTVSIEHGDIEWASHKSSSHGRHSLARLLELAFFKLRWF